MALKPVIYEHCSRCGKKNAKVRDDRVYVGHVCTDPVPGPPNPPRDFALHEVVLVTGLSQREDA